MLVSDFLLSQILASLVVALDLVAFQCKQRSRILLCLSLASALMGWHFFLLDKDTAGWMMALSAVRFTIGIHWQSRALIVAFVVCSLGMTLYSYSDHLSLLSGLANLFATLGSFCSRDKQLRLMLIAASCSWMVHNTLAMTPMGIFAESLFLSSSLLGYYRYHIRDSQRRKKA